MTIALIIAGGVGSRMGNQLPKQFIEVYGKPVLIYTLEGFQWHPRIDEIICVCLGGWEERLKRMAVSFGISKLNLIVPGGETGQESIRNGVYALRGRCTPDDMVIIHDGIRPMVEETVLDDVIDVCTQHGNAVTSMPYNEQIFTIDARKPSTTIHYIPRETLRRVSTPQAYKYGLLLTSYEKAFSEEIGIYGSAYTNTMMVDLGVRLHFAKGSDKNIKLTTPDDLELFKGYLNSKK